MLMNCEKHAYLIMVHTDATHLFNLIKALDDNRNDIYIHVDIKADIDLFKNIKTEFANLYFINERIDVRWGSITIIYAEYALFRASMNKDYSRIHLLSGADFPLKSQDYIHDYFHNNNYEYIDFENEKATTWEVHKKMRLYNFFLSKITDKNIIVAILSNFFRRGLILVQLLLGINRKFSLNHLRKGSNWVSITPQFIKELVKHESEIKKEYRFTHCCDEIYIQTIAWNCGFQKMISPLGNLRQIDFKRGNGKNPYTYQDNNDDYELLKNSDCIFARKFSSSKSKAIVEKLRALQTPVNI